MRYTLNLFSMLHRFLLPAVIVVCSVCVAAHAQYNGDTSQGVDCSSPANAASPTCAGGFGGNGTFQQYPNMYGPNYAPNGGAAGYSSYPQQQAGRGTMGATNGLNGYVPTYNDQTPYGQMYGAYRSPYNPYANPYAMYARPITEFQRVVAGTVGATLPIYGADLFSDSLGTFLPVDRTPVTPDYVVGPGDELLIRAWGQVNFNVHATVDRSGNIYVPQVGNIEVSGLHFQQLDGYLKSKLGRVFRNFDVSVNMGQLRSIQIYVVGNAQRPGSYTLSSLSTLVNALFSSGGPSEQGSMRRIELKRSGAVITTFDFYDLLINGDKSHDAPLLPGDIIYIPPVGPQVAIAGSVHMPAIYELKGSETAQQAIALAGGLSTMAAKNDAQLDRTNSQGARQTVQLALDAAGLNIPLRDGDILRIPSIIQHFHQTITLRGNVANPGRYGWHQGMRILDLIPDQASLETRGYWQRRIALGLPAPEYTPLFSAYPQYNNRTGNGNGTQANTQNQSTTGTSGQTAGSSTQPDQANSQTGTTASAVAGAATGSEGDQFGPSQPPSTQSTASTPAATQTGTPSFSSQPQGSSPSAGNTNTLNGRLTPRLTYYPPGDRYSQGQFPIQNEIIRTGPSIDWAYAAIERTNPETLTTSLIPLHLGAAVLEHQPSANLKLQPGDVVTVFSTADIHVPQAQQVKYVRLDGEVVHGGVYSVLPGETLRDLVRRAGGLTPNAYLYGSEFLRESTQRLQQARLDQYVNDVERDIEESTANASGTIVNAQAAATLAPSIQSQQQLIAKLRQMRATGRIVLNLTPYSQGLNALPDLALEDGDRFIVPPLSSTVNVIGAVYDQNSFLYQRGKHVGQYLETAGGATRNGDKKREFVIRADGSVLSKQYAGGTLFTPGFAGKFVYPGDTIVVPDTVNKTSLLRGLTDWSQVLSGFGLGIASLTILGL